MILVDSSVWIDYFRGAITPRTDTLDNLLGREDVAIGDLMLVEVLQGFDRDRDFNRVRELLTSLTVVHPGGQELAIQAARNFRALRSLGISVRKTIDTIIATWCIESGRELLHSGRDFEPFAARLDLRLVMYDEPPARRR